MFRSLTSSTAVSFEREREALSQALNQVTRSRSTTSHATPIRAPAQVAVRFTDPRSTSKRQSRAITTALPAPTASTLTTSHPTPCSVDGDHITGHSSPTPSRLSRDDYVQARRTTLDCGLATTPLRCEGNDLCVVAIVLHICRCRTTPSPVHRHERSATQRHRHVPVFARLGAEYSTRPHRQRVWPM